MSKTLSRHEIRRRKISCYLELRDLEFEQETRQPLHVYRQVDLLRDRADEDRTKPLRGIRVATQAELVERIERCIDRLDADPVIFRWTYTTDDISVARRA